MAELLDVVSPDGAAVLGVKDRDAVHRDGDWHRAFHLWVVRGDGILLQRRALHKESWPGLLDATAAGHLVTGETMQDGMREVEEELGVTYAFAQLTSLGVHRIDDEPRPGFVNREHQHVYGIRDERPLESWTAFDRVELDGLVLVGFDGFAALAEGRGTAEPARAWDGERLHDVLLGPADLIPTPYLVELLPRLAELGRSG